MATMDDMLYGLVNHYAGKPTHMYVVASPYDGLHQFLSLNEMDELMAALHMTRDTIDGEKEVYLCNKRADPMAQLEARLERIADQIFGAKVMALEAEEPRVESGNRLPGLNAPHLFRASSSMLV